MRKLAQTSTALLLGTATAAFAGSGDVTSIEAMAYLRFGVHNSIKQAVDVQYGLGLDYRSPHETQQLRPAMAQLNFDRRGFVNAWLNGLPVAHTMRLNQEEGATAGDMVYTSVDWAMVALGVVGVGFVASEASNVDEKTAAVPPASPPAPPGPSIPIPTPSVPAPSIPLPGMAGSNLYGLQYEVRDVQHQLWLDSGSGQMGDLVLISK